MEVHRTSMSQELTQDGGRSSNMKDNTSSTSKTRRQSMSIKERMLKDKRLLSGRDTTEPIRDGESSILIKLLRNQQMDTAKNGASISTDYSTSDQDFQ
jgi:hypothetical protein